MNDSNNLEKLKKIVLTKGASVLYEPLNNEINFRNKNFPLDIYSNQVILPANKKSDPFYWADKCREELWDLNPYILIPGTTFDRYGTRHGKGGGWYDRFLSSLNNDWLRIGVAFETQISDEELVRKEWDQAVDWVVIKEDFCWRAIQAENNT